MFTNESNFKNVSRQERQGRKGFLSELGVFAYRDVGEGREQDAEALLENIFSYPTSLRFSLAGFYMVNP
jgi:hypothetical protein